MVQSSLAGISIMFLRPPDSSPEIKKYFDFIEASKGHLTSAIEEEDALVKARFDQLAAIKQQAEATREAHQRKLEELQRPLAPLDGDGLARALLKNVGFLR